jgi:hypothetical protein
MKSVIVAGLLCVDGDDDGADDGEGDGDPGGDDLNAVGTLLDGAYGLALLIRLLLLFPLSRCLYRF